MNTDNRGGKRPNIIIIQADQHRADCLGAAGHPFLKTPNLDRLAAEGLRFTRSYTPCPVCTPARNSLMHGRWPTQHGAIANHNTEAAPRTITDGLPTWSEALRDSGYHLSYVGKWGVRTDRSPIDYGFSEYVPESDYPAWRESQGLPPQPKNDRLTSYYGKTDTAALPEQSRLAWGASHVVRLLESASRQDTPFVISWNPAEPHTPSLPPEPYASLYPSESIPPWPNFADSLVKKPHMQREIRRLWDVDGWSWEDWQPVVARTFGVITLLDSQVGRVLDTLDSLGIAENTMVVYMSDHGDMLGSHGMFDKHYSLYEEIVRVPFIIRWPGRVVKSGSICDTFISSEIDLAATLCDAARISLPEGFAGRSLLPLLSGSYQTDTDRDYAFSQYAGTNLGLYSSRMVRDRSWKYVWNAVAEDELYDLERDPGELVNQIGNAAYHNELRRLRSRLSDWMDEIGDPLLNLWTRPILVDGTEPPVA